MDYQDVFRMPTPLKITGRSSTITNAFVNTIIPVIPPTEQEIAEALRLLDMGYDSVCCSYCGDAWTEWDHLRPVVLDRKPTGYISEIHNLVPACGKCNQSKGNKPWIRWMFSDAKLSPKSRQIADVASRAERLQDFERWGQPTFVDFERVVGQELWQQHWDNRDRILAIMQEAQQVADQIKAAVAPD